MAKKKACEFRLKITDRQLHNVSYLYRRGANIFYISSNETPLALSNLVPRDAAGLRFRLEDARTEEDAAKLVRAVVAPTIYSVEVL